MKPFRSIFQLSVFALLLSVAISSCVKRNFDEPPVKDDTVNLTVTHTIAEIKARYINSPVQITDDVIISGIVISDDVTGNFFKQLIIQDETGGIEFRVDRVALSDDYPSGRRVFVKMKNLWLASNNGTIQVGVSITANSADRIPDALRGQFFFKGPKGQVLTPRVVNINELNTSMISTLVQINGVQVIASEMDSTYAWSVGGEQLTRNRNIEDCNGNRIILRNSGFATFANFPLPKGNGSIVAVYSVFGADRQLFIRDVTDLSFIGNRCGGGTGGDLDPISIQDLRALFTGSATTVPTKKKIKGIVITDRTAENITSRNMVIQEIGGPGITVRFTATNNFNLGDELEIDVSGMELSEFQGTLQLNNVPNANATRISTGVNVIPQVVTIAQINANFEQYESELLTIQNVTITKASGNTFSFSTTLTDATGSIDMFTQSYATFADNTFPTNVVTITGIAQQGGTSSAKQISIRNLTDITGGGGGGDPILISIAEVRGMYSGTNTTVPAARKIKGIVISDRTNGSITDRNVTIQNENGAGILVRFTANNTFVLNDEVEINISGMALESFQGLLQLNNVPNANATKTGTGSITPNVKTISQILADFENLESTLVRVSNVTVSNSAGSTWNGSTVLTDPSGTMAHFTRSAATFSSTNFPTTPVTMTAIVTQGGATEARQLSIRGLSDIQ